MLRRAVLVLGAALLLGALLALRARAYGAALYLCVVGGLFTLGVLSEGWRYGGPRDAGTGDWQPTGERFVDPTSGKMVEVYFNPKTGERDYRDVQDSTAKPR